MKRSVFLFFGVFILILSAYSSTINEDSLLSILDKSIQDRSSYMQQKEKKIDSLKKVILNITDKKQEFIELGTLLDEYKSFNTDSALNVAQKREKVALYLGNRDYIDNSRMNIAELMATTGMYKETIDVMNKIDIKRLSENLHPYYYHIYRTVFGLMADYAVTKDEKKKYEYLTDKYRDSLLLVNKTNELIYTLIKSDQYNYCDQYQNAIDLLKNYMNKNIRNEHDIAICSYTLSESYRLKGDIDMEKKYLIISAISDMKSAVREYVALRKLAVLLYEEGDIDRAYSYVKLCMEDASACNARLRKLEILEIFPIINDAYQKRSEAQRNQMIIALSFISILSIFLIVAIFYVYKQMKKLSKARKNVVEINKKLTEANHSIAENSYLKEEYIGRYMDQCSVYLERMDKYRRSLGKLASTGNNEELYKQIKSNRLIEDELKDFYANFDNSFLQLFPHFVEDFNNLLSPNEKIILKPNEQLNTELRIYALIRLGITDSVKIAQFLRYSVTTIYNYRTKVRNKAAGNRDNFENQVMKIGKNSD